MPRKRTGNTGPFEKMLRGEDPMDATKQADEKRKRANKEAYRYRDEEPFDSRPEGPASDFAEEIPDLPQDSIPSRIRSLIPTSDPLRLSLWFAAVFLMFNASLRGWIPGFDAVATEPSLKQLRAEHIELELLKARMSLCFGISPQFSKFYVNHLEQRYRSFMHRYPRKVSCEEMGVQERHMEAR